jgi:hypothetical protein
MDSSIIPTTKSESIANFVGRLDLAIDRSSSMTLPLLLLVF